MEELGLDPAVVAALSPDERAALIDAVRDARERHRAALQQAIEDALEHVPRLLRGALRKVLFS